MANARRLSREPREIDYRLRPAKSVERKLLVELGYRLASFKPLDTYRYVGMGSIYFADFALFHRTFGMDAMVSLEGRPELLDRCSYNRPYDCIEVRGTDVAAALPELRGTQETILWLDYDGKLDQDRLEEVSVACDVLAPGSLLLVSVNVHPDSERDRLERFRSRFGDRDQSRVTSPIDLNLSGLPALSYAYLAAQVAEAIRIRGAADAVTYRQLVHFRYSDGAQMLTVGWLIFSETQAPAVARSRFEDLAFYAPDQTPFSISVPKLTHRERVELDRLLPDGRLDLAPQELTQEDVDSYAELYRHVPVFVDAVL